MHKLNCLHVYWRRHCWKQKCQPHTSCYSSAQGSPEFCFFIRRQVICSPFPLPTRSSQHYCPDSQFSSLVPSCSKRSAEHSCLLLILISNSYVLAWFSISSSPPPLLNLLVVWYPPVNMMLSMAWSPPRRTELSTVLFWSQIVHLCILSLLHIC